MHNRTSWVICLISLRTIILQWFFILHFVPFDFFSMLVINRSLSSFFTRCQKEIVYTYTINFHYKHYLRDSNRWFFFQCYEINGLTIRTSDEIYKNLPHKFQLQMTTTAKIKKIDELILRRESYEYVDLSEVNSLPMNSVIGNS